MSAYEQREKLAGKLILQENSLTHALKVGPILKAFDIGVLPNMYEHYFNKRKQTIE